MNKQQRKAIKKESGKAYHLEMTLLKRASDVKGIDDLRDKLDMNKLLNSDDTSELEALFETI